MPIALQALMTCRLGTTSRLLRVNRIYLRWRHFITKEDGIRSGEREAQLLGRLREEHGRLAMVLDAAALLHRCIVG
jgi:hypothetical protein